MFRKVLTHLFFPHECLHCGEDSLKFNRLLCENCLELLEILDPKKQCRYCFSPLEESSSSVCLDCRKRPSSFKGVAAVFEYEAVAATLVKQLKFGRRFELAKDIAAFMTIQFFKLDWPLPDIIVPVPLSFSHRLSRGYNQSFLIAKEMGHLLQRSAKELLKRRQYDFPQAELGKKERTNLSPESFKWRTREQVSDQIVLLIDDVMTTRTTLNHCASRLQEGFPKYIYAMTFCASNP